MRIIGLGLVVMALAGACKKEPPASEGASKLTPASTAGTRAALPEEPVAVDVDDEAIEDENQGEPMDDVDDPSHELSDKAGAADLPNENAAPEGQGKEPEDGADDE